jgi:hypothetical protein
MSTIITHPVREAHPRLDAAARHRADRLAKATSDQIQAALAYLSMTAASGPHHTYDPGHDPEVAWYLPDETPEDI